MREGEPLGVGGEASDKLSEGEELLVREAHEAFARGGDAEEVREALRRRAGLFFVGPLSDRRRTLENRAAEKSLRFGRSQKTRDVRRAGGLSEDRHALRVAPEGRDVVPHPFEPEDHVAKAVVGVAVFELQEAVDVDAVVDRDEHDSVLGEGRSVKARIVVVAARRSASGDPHHDGRVLGLFGRPEVEDEGVAAADHGGRLAVGLQGDGARLRGVQNARPGLCLQGCKKTSFGNVGILSERNAAKNADAVRFESAKAPERRRDFYGGVRHVGRGGPMNAGSGQGGEGRARTVKEAASGKSLHDGGSPHSVAKARRRYKERFSRLGLRA